MTAPVPPSPSGQPPTGSDTRTLCAVCGIWQCLARHGGGFCHAVNGPSDTSCGACYANRPTVKPDLTVAPDRSILDGIESQAREMERHAESTTASECDGCRRGLPLNGRREHWYNTGLTMDGQVRIACTAAVASPIREDDDPDPVPMADSDFWESLTLLLTDTDGSGTQHGRRMKLYHHYAVRGRLLAERSRLAGENAELRQPPTDPRALYVQLRDAIAALQSENAELRKDAERWQYFRRFLSVERDRYTPTQYVVADVNLIVETTVREGVNHTVELLVDVARFSAGATGDRE
jgi:hypothetical protein